MTYYIAEVIKKCRIMIKADDEDSALFAAEDLACSFATTESSIVDCYKTNRGERYKREKIFCDQCVDLTID